ncbi:Sporulation initiation inhibitor protein Soj [Granulosicoccus antarcticus IMCC3135]|uniref:Sporulation initiation inhibitor protein Soj n=1 Tax=Granulosicoccus antarcticus IMCC3135 TaxID=1192854 RepID=A0A2Z2P879_9GAMM|nr:Sporulation initiation inhibitor protein Soj [Granulosicoccus antarcticus IMCC3135]
MDYTAPMSRIIAVANQKGGVGKTTTTVNLSAALASMQKRVLLIDLDPQGNATMGCGIDKYEVEAGIFEVLVDGMSVKEAAQKSPENGCDVLPANSDLTAAEVELMNMEQREQRLHQALEVVRDDYDFILIDCPPSLNILTLNAFVASDSVLVPVQCEYYALEGLSALLETIEGVRESVNPDLAIEGLLRTMYDGRNRLGIEVSAQLIQHFGDQVFRTVVPRNVRLAEAPSHGISIMQYDRTSRGALAYLALAGEILRQLSRAAKAAAAEPVAAAVVDPAEVLEASEASEGEPVVDSAAELPAAEHQESPQKPVDGDVVEAPLADAEHLDIGMPDQSGNAGEQDEKHKDSVQSANIPPTVTPDTESADG